jgi:integrase
MSIRRRGDAFQVRVVGFPARTLPTRQAAERVELDLKLRRSMGQLYEEAPTTLGQELDSFLARLKASGARSERTIEFYERSARAWTPFRAKRVNNALQRRAVEDFIMARAAEHPRSAKNELELLKRVLTNAKARGQRVNAAVLDIPAIKHQARRGRALSVRQLYELASWFPEYASRLVLVAGLVGARQNFWFNLTDDLLDLRGGTLTVPAELAKNRREHRLYLTPVEARLLREQLVVRAPGTPLAFPTCTGRQWTRSGFRERVWMPAVKAATAADPRFEAFTFHLLRHTAGSLMASFGMDPASAAERLGHSDGGALFLRRYRHLYEGERRAQAARLGAQVQAALDEEWTQRGADSAEPLNQADGEGGRTWDRTSRAGPPHLVDLSRNRLLCRRFFESARGPVSVLSNFQRVLVWSIGGQRALLVP